jgi:hypothetical protein
MQDLDKVTGIVSYNPKNFDKPYTNLYPNDLFPPLVPGPIETKTLAIPSDMIGCIIGKGGSFVNQVRRISHAKLHIAPQDDYQSVREVTVSGRPEDVSKALNLVYAQLEIERQKRVALKEDTDDSVSR